MRKLLLLFCALLGMSSAWATVTITSQAAQVTSAEDLADGGKYVVRVNGGSYITEATSKYEAPSTQNAITANAIFTFIKAGDTWKVKNEATGNYWGTLTGAATDSFAPADEASAGSWTFTFNSGNVDAESGGYHINRSSGVMHGWGSAINLQIYNIEEIQNVVDNLSELSNDKAYTLTTSRGSLGTNGTELVSTNGTEYSASTFAIINFEGNYYLYSVADSKFFADATLTDDLSTVSTLVLVQTTYPLFFMGMGSNGVNVNNSENGVVVNSWTTRDAGNQYAIIEAADFDPTDALDALDEYFHGPTAFNEAIEKLEAMNWGTEFGQYSLPGDYAGKEVAAIATLKAAGYSQENMKVAQTLLDNAKLNTPDGYYRVKNASTGKYIRSTNVGARGGVVADIDAAAAASDASSIIELLTIEGKQYLRSNTGWFNWVYPAAGYEAYLAANLDKYVHWLGKDAGQVAFSIALGNGEGDYATYLSTGYYTAQSDENGTIWGGDGTAAGAAWIFEPAADFDVTIGTAGYATLYVPFAAKIPSGVEAYTGVINDAKTGLALTKVAGTIPAGTPVVLKADADTYTFAIADDVEAVENNDLQGLYFAGKPEGALTLQAKDKVGFYTFSGEAIGANKAYITVAGEEVKALTFDFETAISRIEAQTGNGAVYNLAGQRVVKAQKGLYIMGGKKVVVK